ncbi:MAG: 7,8-didemethyl-8-hydroxy-5-deazariboflavin synthase CofG [Methanocalculus sp.]|uniref:7,8-didemethyl-8-hydroxy-5-deazariboflavin synthase CofG n=1 Tax=Methanocalculus sp. TaxID=2004547 RepID=UPI00271E367D|nr:7,8-didemethyl-8-hydroxy-5-deazariboflavin synthase CofG [Methanocalculus sp.]MDO9540159.1 7,8-didemethyl-8-hydroxy-5-deazariboflavin synthase CofG [Methanocalculus sp.]
MQRHTITYSKNVFLPLTTVCKNRCGYCSFRTPVQEGCVMEPEAARETLRRGAESGCTEALFTFGERPGEVEGFNKYLKKIGYDDILDYCYDLCREAIEIGLLPHTNAGILTYDELARFRGVNASMGLMLETTARIPAHRNSPGKDPEVRITMIEDAGRLKIPFTTGLLIGIGETQKDREESLETIAGIHKRNRHIQEVIIQNFCPKPDTPMGEDGTISTDEFAETIRLARATLPADIAIQIPPNLADARSFLECGVNDLGGVSPVTVDYINPEHPWPELDRLKEITAGYDLLERLCIYPQYIQRGWFDSSLTPLIMDLNKQIQEQNL